MIELPWPPSKLSPNSRVHWRTLRAAQTKYKNDCILLTPKGIGGGTHLSITFCPPDRRRRDLDNMLASFKHGIDAIASVMGVDDSTFSLSLHRGDPVKGGRVRVEIGA